MIRYAKLDDMGFMIKLCNEFYHETGSDKYYHFDYKSVELTLKNLMAYNFVITDGKHGLFAFNVFPSFYDFSSNVLTEIFWYVSKNMHQMKRGIIAFKLLKQIEKEAKLNHVRHICINSLKYYKNKKIENLFDTLGYTHRENKYMKEV